MSEAGITCTIDSDTIFVNKEYLDWRLASCHITNNDTGLYDVTCMDESLHDSSGIMPATKNDKLEERYIKLMGLNGSILYGR